MLFVFTIFLTTNWDINCVHFFLFRMIAFIDFIPERVIILYEDILMLICKKLKVSSVQHSLSYVYLQSQAKSVFTVFALAIISIFLMLVTIGIFMISFLIFIGIILYIEMSRRKKSKQCKKVLLIGEANTGKSTLLNKVF